MIAINKNAEPNELLEYRLSPSATYDGPNFTPVKEAIRISLLEEQGYICAYCMQRIQDNRLKTKIEHWQSQSGFPEFQLDYRNFLAVCDGRQGDSYKNTHCDTHRGNDPLKYNPSSSRTPINTLLKYSSSGRVTSDEPLMEKDIATLNLNQIRMIGNRLEVLSVLADYLNKDSNSRTKPELRKLLFKWESRDSNNMLKPYCGVAIFIIKKKMTRIQ